LIRTPSIVAAEPPPSSGGNDGPSTARRADIQGLRAIAVLLVVAFHAGLPLPGGFVGVDIFFVISGFVIAGMLLRELQRTGRLRFASFYTRRVRRLLPALALLIVFVAATSTLLLSPFGPQQATAKTSLSAALFSANLQLEWVGGGGYFDLASETNALLHTWSLSVEEQFYLAFPALLAVAWHLGSRRIAWRSPRRAAAAFVLVATAASFALSWHASYGSIRAARFAFYSPVTRGWEFGVGVLLALVAPAVIRLSQRLAGVLAVAGVVLLGAAAVTITSSTPFPGVASLLPIFGTALILVAGTATNRGVISVLGMRPAVWVGDVSYGLYLWHWPLIVFAAALWPRNRWVLVVAAVGSLAPTWLSYRFMENRIRFNDRLTGRRMFPLIAVCMAAPIAACLGLRFAYHLESRTRSVQNFSAAMRAHGEGLSPCSESMSLGEGATTVCTGSVSRPLGTIVLVGDSNADQFTEPVAEAATQLGYGLKIATLGGCPFVDLVRESAPPGGFDGNRCYRFVTESVAALRKSPPALVIMAMASPQLVSARDPASLTDPGSGEVATTPRAKARLLERGLASVLRQLAEVGIPTLVIHPIPHLGDVAQDWQALACPAVRIYTHSCGASVDRSEVERRQQLAREAEHRAVASVPGAASADFTEDLCSADSCAANRNGLWMYRDATHLSVGGALTLTGRFRQLLVDHAAQP
jgi:peptidoglycan/LPS O-acetylase OafA/YrhL